MNTHARGFMGEDAAKSYLIGLGAEILATNYRCAAGEIDIIARFKGNTYAFVEVKSRTSARFGTPAEAVTKAKQRRIIRSAEMYIVENRIESGKIRFDIIEVTPGNIRLIEGAFDASGR